MSKWKYMYIYFNNARLHLTRPKEAQSTEEIKIYIQSKKTRKSTRPKKKSTLPNQKHNIRTKPTQN